jgi:hypothetical protein
MAATQAEAPRGALLEARPTARPRRWSACLAADCGLAARYAQGAGSAPLRSAPAFGSGDFCGHSLRSLQNSPARTLHSTVLCQPGIDLARRHSERSAPWSSANR